LEKYLKEFPPVIKHPYGEKSAIEALKNPFEDWTALLKFLEIDKSVKEVEWAKPGSIEGLKVLHSFLNDRLKHFHDKRNNPNEQALSNLSPWFHFGKLSFSNLYMKNYYTFMLYLHIFHHVFICVR